MKAYPVYKDSGYEWLGKIPSHWQVLALRRGIEFLTDFEANGSFADIKENVATDSDESYAWYVRATDLENKRHGFEEGNRTCDKETYEYLSKTKLFGGELLITKRGEIGKVYLMPTIQTPATLAPNLYLVRLNKNLFPPFAYLWFKSSLGNPQLVLADKSTTIGALYKNDVRDCFCIFPPLSEQQAIADFLDQKTAQIDTLIEKKQRQIDLLQEQRTALINHAVTKGLNPDVRMKDSGVEWLGEIPSHWDVSKLKYVVSKIGSGVTPRGGSETYQKSGIPFIRSQNVHFEGLYLDDIAYISTEVHEQMSNSKIHPNDVLLNITGASIGRCAFVPSNFGEANVNQHVCILRANEKINYQYLSLVLSSTIGQTQVWLGQGGAAREGLNYSHLGNFFIILPPLDEQLSTIERLNNQLSQIDSASKQFQELIGLYQEYRTALISEAVTGKIDVRTAV